MSSIENHKLQCNCCSESIKPTEHVKENKHAIVAKRSDEETLDIIQSYMKDTQKFFEECDW